ncbi:MAG TPA: HAMP domain-containing sensor histidine kinase [Gaiellaceae bacterium]
MTGLALAVGGATLVVGIAAALLLRLLPTVRLQLAGLALLAVTVPLGAVLLSGWVMFHMGDDLKILIVAAASAAAAVGVALAVGSSVARRVARLEAVSREFAAGDLASRAPETGPRELAQLGRSFNEMAATIEHLFDTRRDLVASASHDLRTPVGSILAMLEAIDDGVAQPQEYVPALRDQAQRLAGLVEDLFELARIDAGALAHELQPTSVVGLVEGCIRGLEAEAAARGVRLERRIDGAPGIVSCAPEQVERVLVNLLANALRHTPSDGAIVVAVESGAGEVRIAVEDTGVGITPETARRMFDRFWRGDAARSSDGGAGLGLAIARGLVESHGGRIWAEPLEGGGARVAFTLPV